MPSQLPSICEPEFDAVDRKDQGGYYGRERPTTRVHKNYLLVDLTEGLELTTQVLEILLLGVCLWCDSTSSCNPSSHKLDKWPGKYIFELGHSNAVTEANCRKGRELPG